jgi:hypothetical protein
MSLPGDITISPVDGSIFARAATNTEKTSILTRACRQCRGDRVPADPVAPCPHCGLEEPAIIIDLGVTSATYADPDQQAEWETVGKPAAAARAAAANLTIAGGS